MIDAIEFEKPQALYQQIVSGLEQQIYSGKLLPGDKLPTTLDMSKQFGLAKNTVQQALTVLVERGMVERTTGRGTFVSKRVNCKTIAIVSGLNFLIQEPGRFFQLLCAELQARIEEAGWTVKFYLPANEDDCDKMLFDLSRDVTEGSIRGIFVNCGNASIKRWLTNDCQVPYFSGPLDVLGVSADVHNELYRGLSYLLGRSRRRIAIITNYLRMVTQTISKARADFCPDARIDYFLSESAEESAGYRIVKEKVCGRTGDFDALLVTNDFLCRGAMFGLMECGIRIPDDLAVLTHANKGINILSPVPLTRFEVDPGDYAACILDRLLAKLEGKKSNSTLRPPELIIGKSCGE